MGDIVKQILVKPIQLADQIIKSVDDVQSFKQDCFELKSKTEKLASLLRQASQSSSDLYERPTLRIIENTERVLCKSLSLVQKCCRVNGLMKLISIIILAKCCLPGLVKRLFTISIPATAFKKMFAKIDILIGDVCWLLLSGCVSSSSDDDEYLMGLPSIAQNEPILCLIWEKIDTLCKGSVDDRSEAAAFIVSLARDNDRYGELIIEERGVEPLLKLLEEGRTEGGQESAARAIGILGCDPERVEHIIHAGVCYVFEKILKEGPMKVQSMVAWAISELIANHPKCGHHFAQNYIIPLLVSQLVFEYEDNPATKASMAAKALWRLAEGNSTICRSIIESGGLLCFAVLLEKCPDDEVQYNSAMALMEIAAVAEDTELRWSAFNPNTPAAKAVFDQLLRSIEQADSDTLIPCTMAMGYLARTFTATETRIIGPLVKLLDYREDGVQRAAAIALSKFVCTVCSSHLDHCKAIISEDGTKLLIQIVYFGEPFTQIQALIVLSYIALHLPYSEELAQQDVLTLLEWASKQESIMRDPTLDTLLSETISKLELYQSAERTVNGDHGGSKSMTMGIFETP